VNGLEEPTTGIARIAAEISSNALGDRSDRGTNAWAGFLSGLERRWLTLHSEWICGKLFSKDHYHDSHP